jgi:hypothetical protein
VIHFGAARVAEHQSHAAGVEERHPRRLELQRQAQPISIEGDRARHVVLHEGDLLQLAEPDVCHGSSRG